MRMKINIPKYFYISKGLYLIHKYFYRLIELLFILCLKIIIFYLKFVTILRMDHMKEILLFYFMYSIMVMRASYLTV